MQTCVWGEEFYTGIDPVDEQHRTLIELFNRLSESLAISAGSGDDDPVQSVFFQLMDYTTYHFSTEVSVMQAAGLDARHTVMHRKVHADFVEQVRAMWRTRNSFSNPAEIFLSFLTAWLCLHVLGTDQAMARQLALIKRGETPANAYEIEVLRPKDKSAEAMIKALRNTYHVVSKLSFDLMAANSTLEKRVAERTAELELANEALVAANQKLEVFSQTDGLLGIANRKYFDSRLQDEWNRAIRDQVPIGLLMIDVDFFKNFNDHYGHLAGDACLQAVARAAAARVVRAGDLLARYGGEEFVVILPHADAKGAYKFALGLCQAVVSLNIPHAASAVADCVTVSIGVAAIVPDRQSTGSQALALADQALYTAKQQGRNRVCMA